ncbi:MAG: thioredoxin domain-containing protein [Thermodesulfobacteriota bacterium]
MSNRLKNEKSPYLLQHADNPVDWFPWGEEAFEKAKTEDKPIFLSIGYSTCHWCHVMEHESFEDTEVAKLMNQTFIPIKVDREERPDIDNLYMTVCHILSEGNCGWPLNIIMTPDKKPFFAATYIPKESRFGRLGMIEMVPKIKEVWKNKREEILNSAESITIALKKAGDSSQIIESFNLDDKTLLLAYNQLLSRFDKDSGGFGSAPKFPSPHQLLFLLRYHSRTGSITALSMVEKTLQYMGNGGICDHLGFGFHRYSTDADWLVPHFEKMLYDQALIATAYTEAFQLTRKDFYKEKAEEIFEYLLRDMISPDGGFYSAEDADSEGVEGKFYLWSTDEIKKVLDKDEADLVIKVYNLNDKGNFHDEASGEKTGANILHLNTTLEELSRKFQMNLLEFKIKLGNARKKLFEYREKRVHPYKDDKILTDWNGLMIAALSKAAAVFNNPKYGEAALNSIQFINKNLLADNSRLLHRYRNGDAAIAANIDDYAFFIWGLLEYYEFSFDLKYLQQAMDLNEKLIQHFWDENNGGFYFTPDDGEELIARQKEIYDGAIPSGNSVAMLNLLRLGRITAETSFEEKASRIAEVFSASISQSPISFSMQLNALDFALGPSYEIVIVGNKDSEDAVKLITMLNEHYIPNKVVILKSDDVSIEKIAPYAKTQEKINEKTTVYICQNYVCKLPTNDPDKMLKLLSEKNYQSN